jgi:hypothetical protein
MSNRSPYEKAKIVAVALEPRAFLHEGTTALRRASEVFKRNPMLAYLGQIPLPPPPPTRAQPPEAEHSIQYQIAKMRPPWITIFTHRISAEAYGLGLRSMLSWDDSLNDAFTTVTVRCDGPKQACDRFAEKLEEMVESINSTIPEDELIPPPKPMA